MSTPATPPAPKTLSLAVLIGNSDDKLTQKQWSEFSRRIHMTLSAGATAMHFSGGSAVLAPWQNACWVVEVTEEQAAKLKNQVLALRQHFLQESVTWLEVAPQFV